MSPAQAGHVGRRSTAKRMSFRHRRKRMSAACAEEVMLMGNGRWAKALRIVVWFIIVLMMMTATAPKAY